MGAAICPLVERRVFELPKARAGESGAARGRLLSTGSIAARASAARPMAVLQRPLFRPAQVRLAQVRW
eukprot:5108600-Pyramimonas_sp.AAC.1